MSAFKKIQIVRLNAVHYRHPDLDLACAFLADFGLTEVEKVNGCIYLRGFGVDPYVYVAEASPSKTRQFVGGTWTVESAEDLEQATLLPGASLITPSSRPGGGNMVTLKDPHGFQICLVHGQGLHELASSDTIHSHIESADGPFNTALSQERRGRFRRMHSGPSPVHKLGHYGFVVPKSRYHSTLDWYTSHFSLSLTDVVYDPKTGDDLNCFIHIDRGFEYTDHHSFFLVAGPEDKPAHIHHCSFEVNDLDTQSLGHDWLQSRKWTKCWGIGRHVLGSQIFDYWFDASGNVVEHYTDGDLVNSETPVTREAESSDSLYIWGPSVPLAFLTGNIEDARKNVISGPDVFNSKPAVLA